MRFSDLTNIDRAKGVFINLIGGLFVLIAVGNLLCQVAMHLTFLGALAFLVFLMLLSPVAYLIRERRRPSRPERSRAGAERTPLMPPPEDDEP
jgi:predicted lipid-binding transport protein (Tim44 family)